MRQVPLPPIAYTAQYTNIKMMARTSYHRHQILASIALATAVIAFIFLVVDSGTNDDSGLLLSLRGVENTKLFSMMQMVVNSKQLVDPSLILSLSPRRKS